LQNDAALSARYVEEASGGSEVPDKIKTCTGQAQAYEKKGADPPWEGNIPLPLSLNILRLITQEKPSQSERMSESSIPWRLKFLNGKTGQFIDFLSRSGYNKRRIN